MKLSDVLEYDMPSFLVFCQKKFETGSTLKYVFSEDGKAINDMQ